MAAICMNKLTWSWAPGNKGALGDLGYWDSWYATRDQGHRFGPAIFGKFHLGGRQAFKYNAAYLIGKNSINGEGVRGNTLRMQLEYEF